MLCIYKLLYNILSESLRWGVRTFRSCFYVCHILEETPTLPLPSRAVLMLNIVLRSVHTQRNRKSLPKSLLLNVTCKWYLWLTVFDCFASTMGFVKCKRTFTIESHRGKAEERKPKLFLLFFVFSLSVLAFASAFVRCELALKSCSHRSSASVLTLVLTLWNWSRTHFKASTLKSLSP